MITLTDKALVQIKGLIEQQSEPGLALRVFAKPGGCSGFQYGMGLDATTQEGDSVFEQEGLKVVVDSSSLEYLDGSSIDYVDGPFGTGFAINNPNAPASGCAGCHGGCGPAEEEEEAEAAVE